MPVGGGCCVPAGGGCCVPAGGGCCVPAGGGVDGPVLVVSWYPMSRRLYNSTDVIVNQKNVQMSIVPNLRRFVILTNNLKSGFR